MRQVFYVCYSISMKCVALLRGINVGGKHKVEMARLKAVFEDLGYNNVKTYINSGNVIFSTHKDPSGIVGAINNAIKAEFGFSVPVIIKSQSQVAHICSKIPAHWQNDKDQKTDVIFLNSQIDKPGVIADIQYDPNIETVIYIKGAVVWNVGRNNTKPGSAIKLVKSDLYQHMTVRNINTVRKLHEMLDA